MSRHAALRMIQRRTRRAGVLTPFYCHSFRAIGFTDCLMSGGRLEEAQKMANLVSAKTTKLYDRRDGEPTLAYDLGLLPGFLLMNGYWMAHLYARLESPVLLLYNTVFKSPFRGDQDFDCLHLTADFGPTTCTSPSPSPRRRRCSRRFPRATCGWRPHYDLLLVGLRRLVDLKRANWRSQSRVWATLRGRSRPGPAKA